MKLEKYLKKFNQIADEWFEETTFLKENYDFFKEFFKKINLKKAEWENFQEMRKYIHSFQSMPLAGQKALGNPNHPIEYYRDSFLYLAYGEESIEQRIHEFMYGKYKIRNFGKSAISEILSYVFAEKFVMYNKRDKFALRLLDIDPKFERGDDFVDKFMKFNQAITPVIEGYQKIVGQRTELPLNLEIDQFFSYLYENHKHEQILKDRFQNIFPEFTDFNSPGERFYSQEVEYKRNALERYQEELGNKKLEEMLNAGNGVEALKELSKRVTTNMVHFSSWRRCFGETDEQIIPILRAYLNVAKSEYLGAETLSLIFEASEKQGLKPSWDSFSVTLWAMNPETYVPIKISYFRDLAAEMGTPLPSGSITAKSFNKVLQWMNQFWDILEEYEPSDWIDIHAFVWSVCPGSYIDDNPIKTSFEKVLQQYPNYIPGETVSREHALWKIFQELEENFAESELLKENPEIKLNWSIGKGGLSRIPFFALYSEEMAPTLKQGIYIVYLFAEDMSGFYLTLDQGTTELINEHGKKQAFEILQERAKNYRDKIENISDLGFRGDSNINLKSDYDTAKAYEASTIIYKYYENDNIPSDEELLQDLENMIEVYKNLDKSKSIELRDTKGPQFLRFFIPVIEVLRDIGGEGKSSEVADLVIDMMDIDESELEVVLKSGQTRVKNQIYWARLYLVKSGFLDDSKHGVWALTEKGFNFDLNQLDVYECFKEVQSSYKEGISYWIFQCNPRKWELVNYLKSEDDKVEPWAVNQHREEIKSGDKIVLWLTGKNSGCYALAEVVSDVYQMENEFGKYHVDIQIAHNFIDNPILKEQIESNPIFADFNGGNQGTNFSATEEEYEEFLRLASIQPEIKLAPYTMEDAIHHLFFPQDTFENIINLLKYKKNIILQGPPGVGKTYIAKRLAYYLVGYKDDSKVGIIQFHQSYSYEDFIQGFRPNEDGKFQLQNGVFYEFCKKAQRSSAPHVFIIDEINRGNLSKIFGELMMLIESDKRGEDFAIPLTYSKNEKFYIPENLYLIGMMNTADRSLAMVDYALRRRFSFIDLEPQFNDKFVAFLLEHGVESDLIEKIQIRIEAVNKKIADDKNLGKGYRIGHSFFCPDSGEQLYDELWYERVIRYEIQPLLMEYWFDKSDQVKTHIKNLLSE